MNRSRLGLFTVALTGALALSACGGGSDADPLSNDATKAPSDTIIVGSADFPENNVIAQIYAGALTAKGVKVSSKLNIGSREAYLPGLTDGSIDVIPEYTGNLLLNYDPKAEQSTADDVYTALKAKLPSGLTLLEKSGAQDSDTYTVSKETAAKYGLKSIKDLAPHAKDLTLGGANTLQTRPYGVPGLKEKYGVTFKSFKVLDPGGPLTIKALKSGTVDVADVFSTDVNIVNNGWVSLQDPEEMIPAQSVTPLINKAKVTPTVSDALNAVSAKLTTQALLDMNKQISDGADPSTVAKDWLSKNGLS